MISPQKAYDILFKNGYIGQLKSAIDIGDKYLFVFNSITQKKDNIPIIGRFRIFVNKTNGEIGLFDMLTEKMTQRVDVAKDIKTFYDEEVR